jgi:hypothetical protein
MTRQMTVESILELSATDAAVALATLVKNHNIEALQQLAASGSKAHAKSAKKALYQLKSKGIAISEPVQEAAPSLAPEATEFEAVLSAILGTGERAIFFAIPARGGGIEVFQGVLSDEHGITTLEAVTTNRGVYRSRMRELEREKDLKVLKVPLSRMRLELQRALWLNESTHTRLPDGGPECLRRIGVFEPLGPGKFPALQPTDEAVSAQAKSLHDEKEIGQWLPSQEHLQQLAAIAELVSVGPLKIPPAERRERLTNACAKLSEGTFTLKTRQLYASRLYGMAELFDASDRGAQAHLARATARHLFHSETTSVFARELFVKIVDFEAVTAPEPTDVSAP